MLGRGTEAGSSMRRRAAWAASISTALVSATLVAVGGTASAVAPAPKVMERSATVTFTKCDVRTDRNNPNTRIGEEFDWTTPLELELESPVSSDDLDHRVTVRVGTALPLPEELAELGVTFETGTAELEVGFNLGGSDTQWLSASRNLDGATLGSTFAVGEIEETDFIYGLSGFKPWSPRDFEAHFTGTDTTDTYRSYFVQCAPLRNAAPILTVAVHDPNGPAKLSLERPNGHSITNAAQGSRVRYVGQDFEPLGRVVLRLGKHRVATTKADVTGAIVGTFRVPPTLKARPWRVDAVGSSTLKSDEHEHLYVVHRKVKLRAPARKRAGAVVPVNARGFVAKERVRVQLRASGKRKAHITTVVRANKAGRVAARLRTRPALRGKYYDIVVTGLASGRNATKDIYLR